MIAVAATEPCARADLGTVRLRAAAESRSSPRSREHAAADLRRWHRGRRQIGARRRHGLRGPPRQSGHQARSALQQFFSCADGERVEALFSTDRLDPLAHDCVGDVFTVPRQEVGPRGCDRRGGRRPARAIVARHAGRGLPIPSSRLTSRAMPDIVLATQNAKWVHDEPRIADARVRRVASSHRCAPASRPPVTRPQSTPAAGNTAQVNTGRLRPQVPKDGGE